MAVYRVISPAVWSSSDVQDLGPPPPPNARVLWHYLLSSPAATSIPGVILAGPAQIAEHIDETLEVWTPRDVVRLLDEIQARGLLRWDRKTRVVWLVNAAARPECKPNKNQVIGWRTPWGLIPTACPLRPAIRAALAEACERLGDEVLAALYANIPKPSETTPEPLPNPSPTPSGTVRDSGIRNLDQESGTGSPPSPPEGAGLLELTVEPPKTPKPPRGKPPRPKGPRASWWLTMARARRVLHDVDAVVEAYRRHHPRAKPGDLERGMIAERLLGDDPPFTVGELVEAIDGCHASDFHVEGGHTGLELIMRDRGKVESFRLKGEAKAAGGGRTKTNDVASKAWAEVVAAVPHWRRREPFEVSDTARRGLKASGGASRLMACDERGLAKMRGEFMAALGGRAA